MQGDLGWEVAGGRYVGGGREAGEARERRSGPESGQGAGHPLPDSLISIPLPTLTLVRLPLGSGPGHELSASNTPGCWGLSTWSRRRMWAPAIGGEEGWGPGVISQWQRRPCARFGKAKRRRDTGVELACVKVRSLKKQERANVGKCSAKSGAERAGEGPEANGEVSGGQTVKALEDRARRCPFSPGVSRGRVG